MPEELAEVLSDLSTAMRRLGEVLTDEKVTAAWIAGLVAANGAKWEHAKVWSGGPKGYPRPLPFVIEGPCPFGHRTEDRTDRAKVRFIVEESGWLTLDSASPCTHCTRQQLERWALTCPLCEAGVDHERHYPHHDPLDVLAMYDGIDYDDSAGGFDASPVAWVMREFARLAKIAAARWWTEHTEEAARGLSEPHTAARLSDAQEALGAIPRSTGRPMKPMMTAESGAEWLDKNQVPSMGEKATWAAVKALPGCPAQAVIYAAVKLRKSRATEA